MTDFVTILTAEAGKRLAKTWRPGEIRPTDYSAGVLFQAETIDVPDLDTLAELLAILSSDPSRAIVRGRLDPDVDPAMWVQRLSVPRPDCDAAFSEAPHHWIPLDVDESTAPNGDVEAWRASLPEPLRSAGFIWQASAQAHISPTLRGRAWFWLAEPATNGQLRPWAEANGFDPAHFTPVAIIYTAAPVFEGLDDPLEGERVRHFPGPAVRLTLPSASEASRAMRAESPVDVPPPLPKYDAARAAILTALGPATEHDGRRWALCGPIGGAARKAAWPPGDTASLIREWLAPGGVRTPGIDVEPGVARALGAYSLADPDMATGAGELRALLGPDVAGAIGDAMAGAAWPRAAREARSVAEGDVRFEGSILIGELTDTPRRPEYIIPELELGPGRPFGLVGAANASKSLVRAQIEVDFAGGLAVLGRYAPAKRGRVLALLYEGFVTAEENYARLARGAGLDPRELRDWLVFGQPQRFFGRDDSPQETEDWLCWATEGTSLCTIDPLIVAARGRDENSAEICEPIYMLERVSSRTGVAFILVHHLNAAGARERGHSSIQGAFGARADISKIEAETNARRLICTKAIRYGFEPAEVRIYDTDREGRPWTPTREAIVAGECSWAVAVRAKPAPKLPDNSAAVAAQKAADEAARLEARAQAIEACLQQAYPTPINAGALRSAVGLSGDKWGPAIDLAKRRGRVHMQAPHGRTGTVKYEYVPPEGPVNTASERFRRG